MGTNHAPTQLSLLQTLKIRKPNYNLH